MNIPNIKFNPSSLGNHGIEMIELSSLYVRKDEMNHNPNAPHRMHFYLMIYIEEGEGTHFIDFEQYPFKQGSFIFINKNQIHAFALSSHIQGKAILFTEDYIEQIQTSMSVSVFSQNHIDIFSNPIFTPTTQLAKSCTSLLFEIDKEMKHKESNNSIIMLLFSSCFMMLERERPKKHISTLNHSQTILFHRFTDLLSKSFLEHRDVVYYASKLRIAYKTLNNLCKLASNKTAKQLIDTYVVIEIKRRLILDDKQIQEIAYDFGFM